ncbi:proline dehydrogenase family protein, partial [Actinomycetospora sp.]|uniref:proline dehydrogenase family protein n=1 Tax=Actinomycetospora sp. TaxID=1872135 RepID=UPI002F419BAE
MIEQVTAPTGGLDTALVERAVARADRWSAASAATGHDAATRRLASLVHDPDGVEFALHFVDRVARPDDDGVAARELARLAGRGATLPGFASALDRVMLRTGAALAPRAPRLVVPLARRRLRGLVGHLVVDASSRPLRRHLAAARARGRRLNLNLLGEAVLGEDEADRRLARTLDLIRRPDVDYVSVKASSVASQLVPWDLDGSRDRLVHRLVPLFETARDHGVFVNLDMEEYKDLHLTVALFTALLDTPALHGYSAGIV